MRVEYGVAADFLPRQDCGKQVANLQNEFKIQKLKNFNF
jgi:hypothetical protein